LLLQPRPRTVVESPDVRVRRLFDEVAEEFFQALRVDVTGSWKMPRSFAVLIVESGSGTLRCDGDERPTAAGETWVVPFDAAPIVLSGPLRCLVCHPPKSAAPTS